LPKCNYCKTNVSKETIIKYLDEFSKTPKKLNMCSIECVNKYRQEKMQKIQEQDEYITLCEYIMQIHNQTYLPNGFYMFLNDLRNGTIRQKGVLIKKDKQGVPWQDLLIAYKYSENSIKKAILTKPFDNFMRELQYGLAIVKNNLNKSKQIQKQKKLNEKLESKIPNKEDYLYIKKEFNDDISDILD
jgi:hypothetical protein